MTSVFDEQFLKTIVSIEQLDGVTNGHSIGTGFLLATTNSHILAVTAKHVILNGDLSMKTNLAIRLNNRKTSSELVRDDFFKGLAGDWFISSNADLACRFITFSEDSDIKALPIDRLLSQTNVQTGANVLVLGFPMGLRSERYATPIARRGIVAKSEQEELILDAFVFPGNSGGPVFYLPPVKLGGAGGISVGSPFINDEKIIGVVIDYIPYADVAISPQTQRPRIVFEENSGLCHAVSADKILELFNRTDFKTKDFQLGH